MRLVHRETGLSPPVKYFVLYCFRYACGNVCLLQDGPGFCFCPEFAVSVRRKNGYNPGSAGSEFGVRTGRNQDLVRPGLVRQVRSTKKGPFLSPNSEPWRKNRAEPWFGRLGERPVPFSDLRTLAGLEFGERRVRRKNCAEPWFGRFIVQEFGERTGLNLGSAGSEFGERQGPFSEL